MLFHDIRMSYFYTIITSFVIIIVLIIEDLIGGDYKDFFLIKYNNYLIYLINNIIKTNNLFFEKR